MIDARILRANERYKAISTAMIQLGAALLAAGIVKAYVGGHVDIESAGWIFGSVVLIWIGWMILGFLEPEEET